MSMRVGTSTRGSTHCFPLALTVPPPPPLFAATSPKLVLTAASDKADPMAQCLSSFSLDITGSCGTSIQTGECHGLPFFLHACLPFVLHACLQQLLASSLSHQLTAHSPHLLCPLQTLWWTLPAPCACRG